MELFEKKPDVGRDFNHLSIALSMYQASVINLLIDILENCLKGPTHSEDKELMSIKPLCEEVLKITPC